jgi:hypothetical protein
LKPSDARNNTKPWQSVGLLLDAARPERPHLLRGGLWLLLAAGLEALGPILGKRYIDAYLLPGHYDLGAMGLLLAAVLLNGWAASWIRYAQLSRMAGVARRSVLRLRERVYAHVLALPMAFFDKAITGQLVSRVTNDTEAVNQLYRQVLYVMLDSTIVVLGSLIAMAFLDWRLMLIVATLVPAMVIIIKSYQRLSAPAVARTRQLRSDINAQMAESMAGMAVLQAAGAAGRFGERFEAVNAEHRVSRIAELRANAWLLRPALDLLNVLLLVTVIYAFGRRELSGLEVGLLYAFLAYIARVVEPLIQITMQFGQLQQSMVAGAGAAGGGRDTGPAAGRRAAHARRDPHRPPRLRLRPGAAGAAWHRCPHPRRQLHRHRRPHRQRQEHAAVAAAALLHGAAGPHHDRRPAAGGRAGRGVPRRRGPGAAGALPDGGQRAREHRDGAAGYHRCRHRGRRAGRPRARLHHRAAAGL